MKAAMNTLAGRSWTSIGVPICSSWPALMTIRRSPTVIAAT
jgi:hypothetical protein